MTGVERIAAERQRQMEKLGWTADHDDGYDGGKLAMAAVCYAAPDLIYVEERHVGSITFIDGRIRQLEKAGALIASEIDRLQRALDLLQAKLCSVANPCCDRRDEYNGYRSGTRLFECQKRCGCHD